jgi:hypothetical protein
VYEKLKAEIPEIAKAVNEFKSEQVQEQAFRALVRALTGDMPAEGDSNTPITSDDSKSKSRKRQRGVSSTDAEGSAGKPARPKAVSPTLDKALDLSPKGKKSFKAFSTEKAPANGNERNAVAVYYLEKISGAGDVNANQVYTCFKEAGWRLPSNPRNALQVTASTKGWIDTAGMDKIKMTPRGENFVEHDLPAAAAK